MPRRERTGSLIDEPPPDPSRAAVPAPRRALEQPLDLPAGRRQRRRNGPRLARGINELVVLVLLFVGYNVVRALPETTASVAVAHARHVLSLEGPVFSHLELPLNAWLDAVPPLAVAACYYYAALHYLATPVVLLVSRRRGGWQYWRGYWTLVLASALALVVYALYPVAPPRLVPDLGVLDVLRDYADHGWWGSAASAPRGIGDATNQYAALPSMHLGWALWCAFQMWGFGNRVWRVLAVAYPGLLTVIVLATGNHYLVDVLAGAACVLLARLALELSHRRSRRSRAVPVERVGRRDKPRQPAGCRSSQPMASAGRDHRRS